ncbi:hypothetical protein HMPREF2129_09240 [Corynebacterium tuscaniense DNF00037]|nr:hypothetical protein HMPREF2129_09240 [Corynebacterium tuscaniense DNF00037]
MQEAPTSVAVVAPQAGKTAVVVVVAAAALALEPAHPSCTKTAGVHRGSAEVNSDTSWSPFAVYA